MRSWLVLIAGIALLTAVILVAGYYQHNDTGSEGYNIECTQASLPSSATASLACKIYPGQNTDQGKPKPPWWHKLLAWPEGITAWLLMLTLAAIIWQAWETRKAAYATADAANAAYRSVAFAEAQWELTKEKERARLDVNVKGVGASGLTVKSDGNDLRHLIASVLLRNIGANRAFMGRTYGKMIVRDAGADFGEWQDEYGPLTLPENFLDPNLTPIEFSLFLFPDDRDIQAFVKDLEASRKSLHFFGFIEYETLGLHWRKDFGYDWQLVGSSPFAGTAEMLGGMDPIGYAGTHTPKERIQYGYWYPNESMNKPEYPISREQAEGQSPN
ncbi:MAG TPA: hypothetical protein VK716_09040 [Terracidiphilus sp.]|jgi:hypothetical protein|nr:hypothetical protein [Terracidiphilus sp.]